MSIRLVTDKENVDYQAVADILDHFGLSHFDAATEEKIFKNSYATAFIYDGDQVVGCARAISDGVCQAAMWHFWKKAIVLVTTIMRDSHMYRQEASDKSRKNRIRQCRKGKRL